MKIIRRILILPLTAICLQICLSEVKASTTKVGNGDDGTDLEALKPIQSGPIFEARAQALKTLENLNVVGVPGLGLVIPELQRSDMLMAAGDVRPTVEQDGALEVSDDKRIVYARTFAQPYAATRFFPATQKLTREQLVALHIHEALHRSLPSDIRGNEDIVMHMTLAITSPGANFDRIFQVAGLYIHDSGSERRSSHVNRTRIEDTPEIPLPPPTKSTLAYQFDTYSSREFEANGTEQFHGLEYVTSLFGFKPVMGKPMDTLLRLRLKSHFNRYTEYEKFTFAGPTSIELKGRFLLDENVSAGPILRFSAKALDETNALISDRDVSTVGVFYTGEGDHSYLDSTLTYSPASSGRFMGTRVEYKSILSMTARTGFKWSNARVGVGGELHNSEYPEPEEQSSYYSYVRYFPRRDSFRILTVGPEFTINTERVHIKFDGKWVVNGTAAYLHDMGDMMDRGSGRGGVHAEVKVIF